MISPSAPNFISVAVTAWVQCLPPEPIIKAICRMDLQITYILLMFDGSDVTVNPHLQQGGIFIPNTSNTPLVCSSIYSNEYFKVKD